MALPALVIVAPGTNRDAALARALRRAGAQVDAIPLGALRPDDIGRYAFIALPGGFSYGDALGAGRLWGLHLGPTTPLGIALRRHVARGRGLLGICNGFQALVAAGLLPGDGGAASLAPNDHGAFRCQWVTLQANPRSPCPALRDLPPLRCPIAHGEGRLVLGDPGAAGHLGAFTYLGENPNGSVAALAGLTDPTGAILGLMPHPEDHVLPHQDPDGRGGNCLPLFVALLQQAAAAG